MYKQKKDDERISEQEQEKKTKKKRERREKMDSMQSASHPPHFATHPQTHTRG